MPESQPLLPAPPVRLALPAPRPEPDAINADKLARIGVVAAVCLVVIAALVFALLQDFDTSLPQGTRRVTPEQVAADFAKPQLEPSPAAAITGQRAEKQAVLEQYGWVEKSRGVARIPIERAMQLMVKRQGDKRQ